jgi:hypothetical protein
LGIAVKHSLSGKEAFISCLAGLAKFTRARRVGRKRLKSLGKERGVWSAHENSCFTVDHDLIDPSDCCGDDGATKRHCLDECDRSRLGPAGEADGIGGDDQIGDIRALAYEADTAAAAGCEPAKCV